MTDTQFVKENVRARFNQAATTYNSAAQLPNEVAHRLLAHLDILPVEPKVILDLGAATGYSAQLLQQRFPEAFIIAGDIALSMLQQFNNQSHTASLARVNLDYENLPFCRQSIDLVYANLSLSWANNLDKTLQLIYPLLAPGGLLLFSLFGPETLIEITASWAQIDDYQHVHHFFDMHDIGDVLLRHHFANPVMEMEQLTIAYPDLKSLGEDLKALGYHNIAQVRFKALTGKARFRRFLAAYEKYHTTEGLYPATYEIIYGHARRASAAVHSRVNEQKEILIPLTDIKKKGNKTSFDGNQR